MTKISRELSFLRLALQSQLAQGQSTLRLVEFTQTDGDKVSLNADGVASVEERGSNVRIIMVNGDTHTITEPYAEVILAL